MYMANREPLCQVRPALQHHIVGAEAAALGFGRPTARMDIWNLTYKTFIITGIPF